MTKRLLSALTTLIITGFMLTGNHTVAQVTKVYATSISGSNSSAGALNATQITNLTDSNLGTAATISSRSFTALSVTNGFVEFQFTDVVTANTTTYIKISVPSGPLLGNLVGGGVGSLVNGLVGGLLGAQGLSVQAKKADGSDALATTSTFNQETARIVQDGPGNYYIAVKPGSDYKFIRVTNTINGALAIGTVTLDVYDAYYESGSGVNCVSGNYARYDGQTTGIATANLQAVPAVKNAIDGNLTTSASISLGTVNVANTYVEEVVYFSGTSSATDKYNIRLGMSSALLALDVLNTGVQILGYSGTNATPVYTASLNDSQFLSLNIGTAVGASQPFSVQIAPTVAIDRIAIRLNGAVNVNAVNQALQIYEVTKGSFAVSITGGTAFTVGQTASLSAALTGCSIGAATAATYTWTTPSGTTTSSSPTTTVNTSTPGSYTYSVTVVNDFGIKQTTTTTIVVINPGTISAAQTICSGDAPAALTINGISAGSSLTATIVRWEKSTDATFATGVTTIANTSTTLAGSEIGQITATTYVRAVVQVTGYPVVTSTPVALTVKTTTWNGTAWSNGAPDISTAAFITGNYSPTGNVTACSLDVSNNAVVSFPAETVTTLEKYINVASGSSVTFENNAHLIQNRDSAVNTGNVIIKRNSSNLFRLDYTMWSSPVASQILQAFSPVTAPSRFYEYKYDVNTGTEGYYSVNAASTSFSPATSYLIRMPNVNATAGYNEGTTPIVFTGQFTGVPHNGIITKSLSTQGDRFTAVGNPFPSPINVYDFFATNASVLDDTSALYFWRKKDNINTTSYATLTKLAFVANSAKDINGNSTTTQYGGQIWANLFSTTAPNTWIINPGQGFFMKTKASAGASPVVTFNNAMRRGTHNTQFFKQAQPNDLSRIWLNLNGTDDMSQIAIGYISEGTLGIDAGYDGRAFSNNSVSLYSTAANIKLAIQARPTFNDTDVVPLGYTVKNAGKYTLSIDNKDGVFANGQTIFIRDNELGVVHNLTDGEYTFTTQGGEFTNRLEVIYTNTTLGTDNPVFNANNVVVYQQENVININSGTIDMTGVAVYDIRGRMLYSNNNVNTTQTSITGLQAQHQVLIVEVTTLKGKASKKIIF